MFFFGFFFVTGVEKSRIFCFCIVLCRVEEGTSRVNGQNVRPDRCPCVALIFKLIGWALFSNEQTLSESSFGAQKLRGLRKSRVNKESLSSFFFPLFLSYFHLFPSLAFVLIVVFQPFRSLWHGAWYFKVFLGVYWHAPERFGVLESSKQAT